jgi:NADH dehydrogenase
MSPRVLIAGGGTVGFEVARRLARSAVDLDVTLLSPDSVLVYQSLLPELASGVIEPRHAVVPLRAGLPGTRVISGELTGLDHEAGTAAVALRDGAEVEAPFDHLVIALGAISNVMPVPGLEERAIGFSTVAEALHLRDRVLDRMQLAEATADPEVRRRALTFVFVGGGYSGVEAIGELQSMADDATVQFASIDRSELRWVLVEASDAILPMVSPELRRHALATLRDRGIEVRLETMVERIDGRVVHLSDETHVEADTLVWCAGMRPHPVVGGLGLPVDDDGQLLVDAALQVEGTTDVWAAGDCARVPDLVGGGTCPPSAQYALRQASQLADNLVRSVRHQPSRALRYRPKGELITIGHHEAVGELFGRPLRGWLPWLLRHGYHIARIPTWRRKLRLWLDWTLNLTFAREITELGSVKHPRAAFEEAVAARDADLDEAQQRES